MRALVLLVALAVAAALGLHGPEHARSPRPSARPAPATPASGLAGGAVPAGTTVFDGDVPGVARLDPALLRALRRAADAGAPLVVNSGWRSAAYEDRLRREAVARYGSEAGAARWVATGATSPHVAGEAVDLAPAGAAWLATRGAAYGLCRIYANEPWHFELRPAAVTTGCPSPYADPSQDPRLHP